jgi:hypothetical protein
MRHAEVGRLEATTTGVRLDTRNSAFQCPGAVNLSVRTPARHAERDLPLPKTPKNAILALEPLGIPGNVGLNGSDRVEASLLLRTIGNRTEKN